MSDNAWYIKKIVIFLEINVDILFHLFFLFVKISCVSLLLNLLRSKNFSYVEMKIITPLNLLQNKKIFAQTVGQCNSQA